MDWSAGFCVGSPIVRGNGSTWHNPPYFAADARGGRLLRKESGLHMVVGGVTDLVYLPATLAHQLGAFEAHKIAVNIEDTGAGSKSLQAVLGGSAQVAAGFFDHAIQMAADGQDIKSFVSLTRYPGIVLVASPSGAKRIHTVRDLKGANVGVTAPGSATHFFLNHLLIRNGLKPEDVSVVAMGTGRSRVAAIENSKVDAGVLLEPGVSFLLERAPESRVISDTRTPAGVQEIFGAPEYPSAVLYAKSAWLAANTETARSIASAMLDTLRWIQSHSASEISQKMPDAFHSENPGALRQIAGGFQGDVFARWRHAGRRSRGR